MQTEKHTFSDNEVQSHENEIIRIDWPLKKIIWMSMWAMEEENPNTKHRGDCSSAAMVRQIGKITWKRFVTHQVSAPVSNVYLMRESIAAFDLAQKKSVPRFTNWEKNNRLYFSKPDRLVCRRTQREVVIRMSTADDKASPIVNIHCE